MLSTTLQPQTSPEITTGITASLTASVIIVNYNGAAYLENCLESLQRGLPPECEIILVDNASTDGSLRLVQERFPRVRLLHSNHNLGFAGGNNFGAQLARGRYLVFLNPDTLVEPGWLEALLWPLEEDLQVGLTTARIVLMSDPATINTCGNQIHLSGLTLCRGAGTPRELWDAPAQVSAVSGAAFAIRRDLFVDIGGFDSDFFLYMEDTDLSWRARLAGYTCLYVPGAVVRHDYHLRFGPHKTFYQERNRYLMLLKNLRWSTLVLLAPSLLLAEVVTWGYVLSRQRDQWPDKLRAYAWIVRHWGQVLAKRRKTQALRARHDAELLTQHTHHLEYEQTGEGPAAHLAHSFFDPLFFALRRFSQVLIWR
jgi:GT2 family glycosyltransferase